MIRPGMTGAGAVSTVPSHDGIALRAAPGDRIPAGACSAWLLAGQHEPSPAARRPARAWPAAEIWQSSVLPTFADSIAVPGTQLPVPRPAPLRTEDWEPRTDLPFLRARAGGTAVEDNSQARVDSGRGPPGGGGFRWSGFCGSALPAARVAGRVGDCAVGCACQSQAAQRRI